MSIHDNHRERVRQEFLSGGLDSFSEIRTLELLLFYSRRQGDVNPLAHTLIDTFGSLAGVLDAPMEELQKVPGVGENTATLLHLIPALSARYLASRSQDTCILGDSRDLNDLLSPYFFGARNERFLVACFDAKRKFLQARVLTEGTPTSADVSARNLVQAALSCSASLVVLAHNHPSGVALPSDQDIQTTHFFADLLGRVSVQLYDHVIFADGDMVSLRESGYLF